MGWWVSLGVVSLILRHGAGAEALAWSVLFGLTPFAAVFYPVSVLPGALQPVALALPAAQVEKLYAAIQGIDALKDVRELSALAAQPQQQPRAAGARG